MAKLREELDSHHRTSEQLSAEQMREDDEREQQLSTLIITKVQLKLKLRKIEDEKNQQKMDLERMQRSVEKLDREIVSIFTKFQQWY